MSLDALIADCRTALRRLLRGKTFTAAAVCTLAVGIAGTIVMFALVRGVLLRPLPVTEPDRLIVAWKELRSSPEVRHPFGDVEIETVGRESQLLGGVAGVTAHGVERSVLTENGLSSYAHVALVTGGFFDVLGATPILGRALMTADGKAGAANVLVISNGLWQRRYAGDPSVLGRRVTLGEQPFTIVGVMPRELDYPAGVEIWRTTSSLPPTDPFAEAARREINLVARLRHGVTGAQVSSELAALTERLDAQAPPNALRGLVPVVRTLTDEVSGDVRVPLIALFAAVGLVLLIAIANVANLSLMRAEARGEELAVRTALGAGPGRLVREVLAESAMLALVAGLAGFMLAWWSLEGLTQLVPGGLPRAEAIRIDTSVLVFAVVLVFVAAVTAGLAPALAAARSDLVARLRSHGRHLATARGRRSLAVVQVALAITVVVAAGLLIRTVVKLQSVDLGLAADRLVLLDLHVPQAKYADTPQYARFLDAAIAQLEALPGVSAATPVNVPPFLDQGWSLPRFTAEGQGPDAAASNPSLHLESVHPNYFDTLQIPVVRGRAFTTADRDGTLPVAIISEDLAARVWPGQDAVGKRLRMGAFGSTGPWAHTVVGVAAATRYRTVAGPHPTLYLPAAQFQMTATMLVLRSELSLEAIAPMARDALGTIEPGVQVMRAVTFGGLLDAPLARPRFSASLLTLFAGTAVTLSMIGLYAVMAAHVRQRQHEMAIRVALGATAVRVRRLVLAEAMRLLALGAGIGAAGALVAGRLVRGMLFEVPAVDPLTLLAALVLLAGCSAVATYLPARRATRIDAQRILQG